MTIKLEDESGEVYETKYLCAKTGLSGGWRGFSIAHSIMEGDAVVFQLVMPTQFKVLIALKMILYSDMSLFMTVFESFLIQSNKVARNYNKSIGHCSTGHMG